MMGAPEPTASFDGDPLMECFAREAPWATFSAAQWRKIGDCLAAVGVNLDTQTVEELAGPREWWGWQPGRDYTPAQVPLRYALQEWAYAYASPRVQGKKVLTPKQYAKKLRDEVTALEKALALVNPNYVGPDLPTDEVRNTRFKRRRALQAAIMEEIAERRECIADNEAVGGSSHQSARTVHNDYWRALTRLWLGITEGKASKHRRRHLCRFLYACSQPIFRETTEQTLDSFVRNFFRSGLNEPQKASVV
jgi:hypothetical protein